jgi:hypothetical protein
MSKKKPLGLSLISRGKKCLIHAYQIALNKDRTHKETWCGKSIDGKEKEDRILNGKTYLPLTEGEMLAAITCARYLSATQKRNA